MYISPSPQKNLLDLLTGVKVSFLGVVLAFLITSGFVCAKCMFYRCSIYRFHGNNDWLEKYYIYSLHTHDLLPRAISGSLQPPAPLARGGG